MGIIKAGMSSVGGGLADQWLEAIEPEDMSEGVVFTKGRLLRSDDKRFGNRKSSDGQISNGSIIHVYPNQAMLLVDSGRIVDFTAEPGMYEVNDSSLPSLFNGELSEAVKETFSRIKYSGINPTKQEVCYINLAEIKGIKFGTKTPLNYFDDFYNSELFLRTFGTYSLKITDPLKFYENVIPKQERVVRIEDINEQFISEFLEALQASINQMSVDGIRISHVPSKGRELSKYMSETLDDTWRDLRGMEILAVGIASISYTDDSKELINMRNRGAMLSDPNVRESYVQGSIARGLEAAGSNEGGAAQTYMGMGVGMNATGGFMGQASAANQAQISQQLERERLELQRQREEMEQLKKTLEEEKMKASSSSPSWICPSCGTENNGNFCQECGAKKPEVETGGFCPNCGKKFEGPKPKFCPDCGQPQGM